MTNDKNQTNGTEQSMENSGLISVIMPAYNAAKYIRESIDSVIQQTYSNWELIVVDDESTDDTAGIINNFTVKDARIKYFFQPNSKQGKARNTGIKNTNGDLIAFLDADDIWLPCKLEQQLKIIQETAADLVFSNALFINDENKETGGEWGVGHAVYKGTEAVASFLSGNKIPLLTVLVKKQPLLAAGGFRESDTTQYGEDYDLWIRLLLNDACFVSVPDIMGGYRKHSAQSTHNKATSMLQMLQLLQEIKTTSASLAKEKRRSVRIWEYRYLVANKEVSKKDMLHVISVHYFMPSRLFLKMIYFFSGPKLLRDTFKNICAVEIKIQKAIG